MSRAAEETIFGEAVNRPAGPQRAAYLNDACGGDAALRARVDDLLSAHERAGGFLESPPLGLAAAALASTPADPAPSERPGATIGRFTLLEQIGEGGMGAVFRAEQTQPVRREVALKIIKPGMDTREVIARFEAERQALAIMDHPGVAKVLDAGATAGGRPYFVMELVRGVPITEYCDRHQLAPRQRLELFVHVCQAVQHAHQKGIIHRDLKPSNVLVTLIDGRAVPKVIDFGIAKATGGQRLTDWTQLTQVRQLIGTPLYMSPEQAEPSSADGVDTRSDVYSLGVLLYELLTGTTPFDGKRLARAALDEVRRILREEDPPRPSTRLSTLETLPNVAAHRSTEPRKLSATIRGELDWIVMKALEKEQSRRYETASGLARDVERYLAQEPVEAHPPSQIYWLRKFARRYRVPLAVAASFTVLLAAAAIVSTWQAVRATRATAVAVAEQQRARRAAGTAHNVAYYLQAMVSASNLADTPQSKDVIRQMAANLAKEVKGKLADDPEAESELHNVLGWMYSQVEEVDNAEYHFWRAVELRRAALGPQSHQYAGSLVRYAGVLYDQAQRKKDRAAEIAAKAEAPAREAMEIYSNLKRTAGVDDADKVRLTGAVHSTAGLLTSLLYQQGRTAEAAECARQVLREDPESLPAARALATVLVYQTDTLPAEQASRDAELAAAVMLRHPAEGWGIWIEAKLAYLLKDQGKLADAERLLRKALAEHRTTFGNVWNTAQIYGWLVDLLEQQGKSAEASAVREELLRIYPDVVANQRNVEGENVHFAMVVTDHGARLAQAGRIPEAEAQFREGLRIRRTLVPEDAPEIGWSLSRLHHLLRAQDRDDDVQNLWRESVQLRQNQLQATNDPQRQAVILLSVFHPLLQLDELEHAKACCRKALELNPDVTGAAMLNETAWTLATAPEPTTRDGELAVRLAEAAHRLVPDERTYLNTFGVALYRAGQHQRAITELERCVALPDGGDAWDFFFLAMAHQQCGHQDQARRWYDKALQWTRQHAPDHPELLAFQAEAQRLLAVQSPTTSPARLSSTTPVTVPSH